MIITGKYPNLRLRRNRKSDWSRRLIQENKLSTDDLIWPIFISDKNKKSSIDSMPGIFRIPLNEIVDVIGEAQGYNIPAIALFPETNPNVKDELGSEALNENNLICEAIKLIKKNYYILKVK